MTDLQQYELDSHADMGGAPSKFIIPCHVTDVVDLDYIVPVEFCEDIIEGTFEGRTLVDLHIQANHLFEDINNCFDAFVKRASCRLIRVYDSFNKEIK